MADVAVENAPNDENDDNWLYGESNNEQADENDTENAEKTQPSNNAANKNTGTEDKDQEENEAGEGHNDDSHFNDEHFGEVSRDNQEDANGDADSQENGDSDSDDSDDVKVTIGEIKSGPQAYASLNIKRGVGLVGTGGAEKPRQGPAAGNKVTLEDLEGPGSINGVPALEFNIDTIEDKPWNKPGADISDYFNYGFNEVTWSSYCERQRRMRVNETGVGLHAPPPRVPAPDMRRPPGPIRHDEMAPGIQGNYQNRENTIQVMTAERREYGRGPARDAPPEYFGPPPPDHYYPPPVMSYDEPWAGHPGHALHPGIGPHPVHPESGWAPGEIKELTPGPLGPPAPAPPPLMGAPPQIMGTPTPLLPHYRPPDRHERDRQERDRHERDRRERDRRERDERHRREEDERDRDRDRDRSRSIKPDRIREKSFRRERSRSRSRRHKSRSRSPRPRERSRDRERDRDRDRERDRKTKTKETKEKEDEK